MAAGSVLCGSHTARRQTRRPSGAGGEQVRNGPQPQNRKSTRPDRAAGLARRCRRGHRVMRRREVITLLGGAAAWPLAARAQQPGGAGMRHVGVLMPTSADNREQQATLAAMLKQLEQLGWRSGTNVNIEIRWSAGAAPQEMRR